MHTLQIKIIVAMHKATKDIVLSWKRLVDFQPTDGMKIKFTREDEEVLDIVLTELYYDYDKKVFVTEQRDDTLLEEMRGDQPFTKERINEYLEDQYLTYGWERA
jgi:hypothetical protein